MTGPSWRWSTADPPPGPLVSGRSPGLGVEEWMKYTKLQQLSFTVYQTLCSKIDSDQKQATQQPELSFWLVFVLVGDNMGDIGICKAPMLCWKQKRIDGNSVNNRFSCSVGISCGDHVVVLDFYLQIKVSPWSSSGTEGHRNIKVSAMMLPLSEPDQDSSWAKHCGGVTNAPDGCSEWGPNLPHHFEGIILARQRFNLQQNMQKHQHDAIEYTYVMLVGIVLNRTPCIYAMHLWHSGQLCTHKTRKTKTRVYFYSIDITDITYHRCIYSLRTYHFIHIYIYY